MVSHSSRVHPHTPLRFFQVLWNLLYNEYLFFSFPFNFAVFNIFTLIFCLWMLTFLEILCYRKIQIASPSEIVSNVIEGTSHGHDEPNDTRRESKLELFGFDSLVNILGLKRYVEALPSVVLYHLLSVYCMYNFCPKINSSSSTLNFHNKLQIFSMLDNPLGRCIFFWFIF